MSCLTVNSFRAAFRNITAFPRTFRNGLEFTIYQNINEVPKKTWESLNGDKSIFLSIPLLEALSASQYASSKFFFAVFKENNKAVGISVFQVAELVADNLHDRLDNSSIAGMIGKHFTGAENGRFMLVCGSAFATGEHGYYFDPAIPTQRAMNSLCEVLTNILKQLDEEKQEISAVLIKDFYENKFPEAKAMEKCGFRSFNVDHNMVMPILKEWNTFENYLDSLNSKFRTKAKAAFKRSEILRVEELSAEQIEQHAQRIQELYNNVHERADFKIGHLDVAIFACMQRALADKLIFKSYFFEEKMIGFSIALDGENGLEAFLVGIDYSLNAKLALYSRMLYDYIDIGISRRKSKIIFGRTAGEIKSSVGALPVDLKCCIRHPGRLPNVFLNLIFKYVEPSPFPIRNPYKEKTLLSIQQQQA